MAQQKSYLQGYSECTIATHLTRTAETDAAFLVPHIKKTDHILDAGCGPGTITTGFAKYVSSGAVTGIDVSPQVLQKAKELATEAKVPTEGPGSVIFKEADFLKGLPFPDETFDIVFSCQVFGHLPPPDMPLQAMTELRRVLKPGGILATRDAAAAHFYPQSLDLDRLWTERSRRVFGQGMTGDSTGTMMPALYRRGGFDVDGGKVRVGAGTLVYSGQEARRWLAWRGTGQLKKGDAVYGTWLDARITEEEIGETVRAVERWAETDDAWYAALQCEVLGWK